MYRILYVDDEPSLLDIGKLFLERSGDFTVTTSISASDAIRFLEQEKFDAIISDYQMPGMNGIQFLVEVRTRFGPIPFILFTGRGREEVVIQAINSGADFYLQKGGEPGAQFAELSQKIKSAASRKKAEDSLAESERVHATMISNLPGFVYRCANDCDWTMEYISDGCREITGYAPDELLGNKTRTYNDLVHPEFQKSLWDKVQNFLEKKEIIEVEYPLITKTGETRWVWERGQGIYSEDGRLLYLEGFITDITERKMAGEALKNEQEFTKLLLNTSPAFFVAIGADGKTITMSKSMLDAMEYTIDEIKGIDYLTTFVLTEDRKMVAGHFREIIFDGQSTLSNNRIISKSGKVYLVEWYGRPVKHEDKKPDFFVGIGIDITGRKKAEDAIKTAEDTYRNIFLNSQIGLFRTDVRTGLLLDVNDTVARFIGYPDRASLLAKPFNIVERYADAYDHEKIISLLQADGEFRNYEARFVKNDGSIIWMRFSGRLVKEKGWLEGVSEDITERKRAEEALGESESFNRNLVENLPDYIGISAPDGKILYMNASATNALGYTMEEIIGTSVLSYVAEECRGDVISKMAARPGGSEVPPYEIDVLSKDGRRISVIVKGTPIRYRNSPALLLVLTDITERKTAEKTLHESEEKYRMILDNSRDLIYTLNTAGEFTYLSPSFTHVLGYSPEDLIGHSFHFLIHPDDLQFVIKALQSRGTDNSESPGTEYRVRNASGEWRWHISRVNVVRDPAGNILYFVGISNDITEPKVAEEAVRVSEGQKTAILDGINTNIAYVDKDLKVIWANKFAAESVNKSPAEMVGHTCHALWADPARPCDNCPTLKVFETKQSAHIIQHTPDGRIWDERGEPVFDANGNLIGVVEIAEDITGRKKVEEALAESKQRYDLALEGTGAGLWDWDMVHDRVVYSRQWKRMLGYEDHEVENSFSGWKNLWHPDDSTNIEKALNDYLAGKTEHYEIIHRLRNKDGNWQWILTRGEIIKDAEGKPVRWVGTNIDITGRKRVEEALERQTATFAILNDIISTANKANDLPQLLNSILTESLRLMDFDAGGIYLVDRSTRIANIVHSKDLPQEFLAEIQTVPIDTKPYDTLFIQNEAIISENYTQIAPDPLKKFGFKSIVSIPLLSKGVAIGALNLASKRRHIISDEEKQTLFSIGRELGSTIERMAAEDEVKNASKNLETLFNSMDEMVFVLDMQGRILVVNSTVLNRLLYTSEELTGMNVLLLHVPDQRDEALRNVQGMIAGTIDSCPVPVLAKDGTRIEVETKVTRGLWNGNEVLIGVSRDITERKRVEEALRESEETFRIHIENSFDVIFTLNSDGEFVFVSPAWERHFGYPVSNIIGKSFAPFVHPEDIAPLVEYLKRVLITGQSEASPAYRVRHADGRWLWFIANGTPIVNTKGEHQFVGVGRDITERKVAEEALKEHDEKFRLLLNSTAEAIYGLDMNGNCTFCNNSCLRLLGYKSPDDLLGKNMHWQIHHKHPDGTHFPVEDCRIFRAFNKGEGTHVDDEVLWRSDGSSFPAEYWSYPQRREDVVVGAVVTFIDITERKVAEEALSLSEQKLSSILNDITDVVWSLSWPDMNVHYISPSVEKVYGRSVQDFIDKPSLWAEITHPDDKQISDNALEQLRKTGSAERECRIARPDGSIVWIHDKSKIIFDQNDTPIRVDGITSDITERKELEKEMEFHAQELQKFSTSLAAANKKLTLLSSISRHDINNQLTVLVGYLGLMENKNVDASFNDYFVKVSDAAQRISSMIQFTREYESIGVNAPVWQDCRTLIDTAAKDAPLGKIIVKNDLPAGAEVFADPLVVKVFYNLMDNAVRYGGKITNLRFSVEEHENDHLIVCEDDGVGVVAGEKEKIFERGFGKNTGLGLALSREIFDITGISIKETGEPGKGARFEMAVPKGAWRTGKEPE